MESERSDSEKAQQFGRELGLALFKEDCWICLVCSGCWNGRLSENCPMCGAEREVCGMSQRGKSDSDRLERQARWCVYAIWLGCFLGSLGLILGAAGVH